MTKLRSKRRSFPKRTAPISSCPITLVRPFPHSFPSSHVSPLISPLSHFSPFPSSVFFLYHFHRPFSIALSLLRRAPFPFCCLCILIRKAPFLLISIDTLLVLASNGRSTHSTSIDLTLPLLCSLDS